jgi:DNA-binding CsgD family transcriptional regulator
LAKHQNHQLTDGQKACLRLVAAHFTSKEIARELGISPFTVDQRLDAARKKLGAESRKEAAIIFTDMEAGRLSERLVYDPEAVAGSGDAAILTIPTSDRRYPAEGNSEGRGRVLNHSDSHGFGQKLFSNLRVPPIGGGKHEYTYSEIFLQAVNIAFYAALMVGIVTIILSVAMNALS